VDIYTRVHDPRDREIYALGKDISLIHLKAGDNVRMDKLALYPLLPDFAGEIEAFREANNLDYDLVFSHYWLSALVGEALRQQWRVPHLTMFHTLGAVKNSLNIGENEPELRIQNEKDLSRRVYRIIAPTEREKEAIINFYDASPARINVIPCGVNMDMFQPVDKEKARRELGFGGEKMVLFVGRIEPVKGIEQLLRAASLLQNKTARLVVIGGDDQHETAKLRALTRRLRIEDRVTFPGSVKQDRLPYYYSAADVSVVSSYYESFGLVTLESLACGTPVVTTDVGGAKDILREGATGYVVADNDPRRLAEKIDLLLSRENNNDSALSIRESISVYNWSNIAEKMAQEFRTDLITYSHDCS
jgi:D-inositol-3-phosphate glycosyltransferase